MEIVKLRAMLESCDDMESMFQELGYEVVEEWGYSDRRYYSITVRDKTNGNTIFQTDNVSDFLSLSQAVINARTDDL